MIKSFALGASAAGLAGSFFQTAYHTGATRLIAAIQLLLQDLTMMMTSLGAKKLSDLEKCPLIIAGELYHSLDIRGLDPKSFARRKKN